MFDCSKHRAQYWAGLSRSKTRRCVKLRAPLVVILSCSGLFGTGKLPMGESGRMQCALHSSAGATVRPSRVPVPQKDSGEMSFLRGLEDGTFVSLEPSWRCTTAEDAFTIPS